MFKILGIQDIRDSGYWNSGYWDLGYWNSGYWEFRILEIWDTGIRDIGIRDIGIRDIVCFGKLSNSGNWHSGNCPISILYIF
ncbi:hypothetical protein RclHR1_02100019 [Rhizophagus clarus]|uniref:Uncharacterized protein n=1 Tax=Rhizophagus clarus TaxID=94130 RepID=A0A2Z6QSP9_9GLOM|nr:hypothetical protein RclHR1_02100019 [Rhizophagus clarus]GES98409.1 hypothetical protein RCL_e8135_RclHR1_02100019 [Rhizophagus clarus]